MTTVLSPDDRQALLAAHPAWSIVDDVLHRDFLFTDFAEAMGFVVRLGLAAEKADHHPDIDIRWNTVTVRLTTHSAGTLTNRDLDLVERIAAWEQSR